jgi:ribosomal protein L31E
VNEFMWARGIQHPPRKIRIRAVKTEDDIVTVYLG